MTAQYIQNTITATKAIKVLWTSMTMEVIKMFAEKNKASQGIGYRIIANTGNDGGYITPL